MITVRLRRWVDLVDRVGWTFVQAFAAATLVFGWSDWRSTLEAAAIAGAIAAAKTLIGQNVGESPIGDLVPGAGVVHHEDH